MRAVRRTLYVRDDDYRLSFLSASFVTLTNLVEDDWQRIAEQPLAALFVSIRHQQGVRRACLGKDDARYHRPCGGWVACIGCTGGW